MVPIVNFTGYADIIGEKWAVKLGVDHIDLSHIDSEVIRSALNKIFGKQMCCGIIANCNDGQVYHARNFDN